MQGIPAARGWLAVLLVAWTGAACASKEGAGVATDTPSPAAPKAAARRSRPVRRLPVKEYVDRMKAGWIGQMAGVGLGGPTEFRYKGRIIPEDRMPTWHPGKINQFGQDDIYVEMTFLRTLELHGLDAPIRQAGIDFANSRYRLWHANNAGRSNLRKGIAPPDSGHPRFNRCADDIDYQIEADFSGLIAPGLPNTVIALGEKFGRLMNYGDGVYGGQFVGAMYAEAFFETDPVKIVRAGLACVPAGSQYYECIADVLRWHEENPDDWQATWRSIEEKYQKNPAYRRASCDKGEFNIDAKINGAYIVMGLLYGGRDLDGTMVISCRCGQDSDCNPSNAAGVIFTTVGYSKLPERFTSALDSEGRFSHTPYNFPKLIEVCEKLAREAVVAAGGRIEKDEADGEVFVIPMETPKPGELEQCWEPGPIADSRFTEEEREAIGVSAGIKAAVERFAPGWKVTKCGEDMDPGLRDEWNGRRNVLVTHPLDRSTGCVLARDVELTAGGKTTLRLVVGHHPQGDWTLVVKADGKELFRDTVGRGTATKGWREVEVDLGSDRSGPPGPPIPPMQGLAGRSRRRSKVLIELENRPSGWAWEAAYWAVIAVDSER